MSPIGPHAGQSGRVRFEPASGAPDVKWIHSDRPAHLSSSMSKAAVEDRTERTNALIVTVLTLACTALSLYDLFLLAAGS